MQNTEQFIADNLESIDDMLNSAKAVKGRQFSELALMSFHGAQLMQVAGLLAHEVDQKELSDVVFCTMSRTLLGMMRVVGDGLSENDFHEACELGQAMMERKLSIDDRLQKDLN